MQLKNNKTLFKKRGSLSVVLSVTLSVLALVAVAEAATTISTNISTGGTLSVTGASTFTGPSTFSDLASFNQASTTRFSVFDTAYFGGSATSTFSSSGILSLASALGVSSGGTGLTTFGGNDTVLFTTAADTLSSSATFTFDGTNLGVGTSTPGTLLSLGNTGANTVNISATATSTFGSGLNVLTGCFAVNGTCVSGGSSETTKHKAKMSRDAAQSISSATFTKIAFDNEVFDEGGIADSVTNDRFDISRDGKYLVHARWGMNGCILDDGEQIVVAIYLNGSTSGNRIALQRDYSPAADSCADTEITEILDLTAGDFLEMHVFHNEGTSQNTNTGTQDKPTMSVVEL